MTVRSPPGALGRVSEYRERVRSMQTPGGLRETDRDLDGIDGLEDRKRDASTSFGDCQIRRGVSASGGRGGGALRGAHSRPTRRLRGERG